MGNEQFRSEDVAGKTLETFYDHGILIGGVLAQDAAETEDIKAGTVMGVITASSKYAKYDDGHADGTQVAKAILYEDVSVADVKASDKNISVWIHGIFKESDLTGLDAAAKVDVKNAIFFI